VALVVSVVPIRSEPPASTEWKISGARIAKKDLLYPPVIECRLLGHQDRSNVTKLPELQHVTVSDRSKQK